MAGKKNCMQLCALLLLLFKKRNTRTRLLAVEPESTANRDTKSENMIIEFLGRPLLPSTTAHRTQVTTRERASATRGGKLH